jgi:hypothetical protein
LFNSFEQCMETIHSFPSLVHLDYNFQHGNGWSLGLPAFGRSPAPPLHSLGITSWYSTVQKPWSQLMWQWLHRSQTRLSTIRLRSAESVTISADDVTAAKLYSFTRYLHFLGPSLEVLEVCFNNTQSICKFLVLSYILNLNG